MLYFVQGATMPKGRRITFSVLEEEYEALERMARQQGQSLTDTLRDAIMLKTYLAEAQDRGEKVLLEKQDGSFRELVFK
jgi:uncharacterized protein (DUF1778 family)